METTTLNFDINARRVYVAVRTIFERQSRFKSVKCYDDLFVIEARHGVWLSPFSEHVKVRVVATGTESCRAVVESSSRSVLNLLNFGANSKNVSDLGDYICNEVYRLVEVNPRDGGGIVVRQPLADDHSTIRIVKPEIKVSR